jgi:hypothetical protein
MFLRVFSFLFGFGLAVIGLTEMILFLNLMVIGYTFKEYVNFIIRRPEPVIAVIGIIILSLSIFIGGEKYELHI